MHQLWVQNVQAVQAVQDVLKDWNYLNELNAYCLRSGGLVPLIFTGPHTIRARLAAKLSENLCVLGVNFFARKNGYSPIAIATRPSSITD